MGLKKKATQSDIARVSGVDQGTVSRILNKETRNSFSQETVDLVFRVAREIGYLHSSIVESNRRSSSRRKLDSPCNIKILIGTNTLYDSGKAVIGEISSSGILLKNLITSKHSLPLDKCKIDVAANTQPLKGFHVRCDVVRFTGNEHEFALALKYVNLNDQIKQKINTILGKPR